MLGCTEGKIEGYKMLSLAQAEAIKFDNPLLWLIYLILAGVGIFLMKVGFDLVKSIQSNTLAVVGLTGKIEKLCEQQAQANALVQSQMSSHMLTIRDEFQDIRDAIKELREHRKGSGG